MGETSATASMVEDEAWPKLLQVLQTAITPHAHAYHWKTAHGFWGGACAQLVPFRGVVYLGAAFGPLRGVTFLEVALVPGAGL